MVQLFDPSRPFDETMYLLSLIGWYLASAGAEPLYHTDPEGHHCLELAVVDGACIYGE